MPFSRRSFLSLFCAAPFAAPALAKEAAAEFASGGYVRGVSGAIVARPMRGETISSLSIKLDTTAIDAALVKLKAAAAEMAKGTDMHALEGFVDKAQPFPKRHNPLLADQRIGDWMQTSHGRQFWPLDPRPEEIHVDDIAAALSKMCRYGGHCKRFYSVAEHCVLMANAAPSEYALDALLHDASEAYLADVIRPIKSSLTNYHAIEAALERVIAQRFGTRETMPAEVKRLDNAILADEMQQNMATPPADWRLPEPPLGVTLQFWSPEKAEFEFLAAFRRYGGHWA